MIYTIKERFIKVMRPYNDSYNMLASLLDGESDPVVIMSNTSAHIYDSISELNWAGFYRVKNGELILGPFQGKVACMHISFERGVCGAAYRTGSTTVVDNVHEFPGHIACDSASNSEIVIPVHGADRSVIGVLDVDSPVLSRFKDEEISFLTNIVTYIEKIFSNYNINSL